MSVSVVQEKKTDTPAAIAINFERNKLTYLYWLERKIMLGEGKQNAQATNCLNTHLLRTNQKKTLTATRKTNYWCLCFLLTKCEQNILNKKRKQKRSSKKFKIFLKTHEKPNNTYSFSTLRFTSFSNFSGGYFLYNVEARFKISSKSKSSGICERRQCMAAISHPASKTSWRRCITTEAAT